MAGRPVINRSSVPRFGERYAKKPKDHPRPAMPVAGGNRVFLTLPVRDTNITCLSVSPEFATNRKSSCKSHISHWLLCNLFANRQVFSGS